jgi:hypothetical protein
MTVSVALSYLPPAFVMLGFVINFGVGMLGDSMYIYFVKQAHVRHQKMNPGNIPLIVLMCIHIIVIGVIFQVQSYSAPEAVEIFSDKYVDDA